jgi:CubicO group peptidase (beta-lactamase class C family)
MSGATTEHLAAALPSVDEAFGSLHAGSIAPGVAYGIVADGVLVHAVGLGVTTTPDGGSAQPTATSIFRIASMTKSFTAMALLMLRDRGELSLDTPVGEYVPELRDLGLPTADSAPLSPRDLVTMSSGLPTDDPWADRMESTSVPGFNALLREGFRFAWPPGSRFEYSNLGFAILGRVISNVGGMPYPEFVSTEILRPLGLLDTGYDAAELDATRVVRGHRRSGAGWEELPFSGPGEFSALAGLFSTVSDLARWVAYLADAFPPRDDAETGPLRRSSRREMQRMQRLDVVTAGLETSGAPGSTPTALRGSASGYGFGLFVQRRTGRGDVVSHAGGYPGFGSYMCWHPPTGFGVIAVANATYAGPGRACMQALEALLDQAAPPARRIVIWPETLAARAQVEALVDHFDDGVADELFGENMDLDVPRPERKAKLQAVVSQTGVLSAGAGPAGAADELRADGPADLTWRRRGRDRDQRVSLSLNPQRVPRLQSVTVDVVPELSRSARQAALSIVAALTVTPPIWPADLPTALGHDPARFERLAALASALGGRFELIPDPVSVADDGVATLLVRGPTCSWHLQLRLDPATGAVDRFDLRLQPVSSDEPVEIMGPDRPLSTSP